MRKLSAILTVFEPQAFPAKLDVYHTNMHAFDMMRPHDAQSVAAAEAFERQFADARARYFAPQENTV